MNAVGCHIVKISAQQGCLAARSSPGSGARGRRTTNESACKRIRFYAASRGERVLSCRGRFREHVTEAAEVALSTRGDKKYI